MLRGAVGARPASSGGGRRRARARRELGPAGFLKEMGLIDGLPRSATVVAVEPTECALLAKWDFANDLRKDPDIALAPVLHPRIRELDARLERHGAEPAAVSG